MWPLWLLDIDGVINANPYKLPTYLWPEDQWVKTHAQGSTRLWPITTATPVIDFLWRVHRERWAEIVWLTTWQKDANNVSDALGLPHFRALENPMHKDTRYAGRNWWKLAEATRMDVSGSRPLVWTDDDISQEIKDLFSHEAPQDSLLITPNGAEGLAPKHLERIATFLNMPYKKEE